MFYKKIAIFATAHLKAGGCIYVEINESLGEQVVRLFEAHHLKNIEIKKGVYVSVMGPNLETKAEYRWLRNCGADMVGMSTVPEVIVANQCNIKCAALSVITDECNPDKLQPVNIAEIIEIAGKADKKLTKIFCHLLMNIDK